jgi:DeoR/GlpR family transcriptional regulator of sugar metabolism
MLKEERFQLILDEVIRHNKVRSAELCKLLKVSEDTVRRDLKELSEQGLLRKVHGGAVGNSLIPLEYREQNIYHSRQTKQAVAKALELLQARQLLLMDDSAANLELACSLPEDLALTVFTNSIAIAHELCKHPGVELFMLGGKVSKKAAVAVGIDVLHFLGELHANICFLGANNLHPSLGLTAANHEEAQVKRKLLEVSAQVVVIITADKIGTIEPFRVAAPEQIDLLITDLDPSAAALQPFRDQGIRIW